MVVVRHIILGQTISLMDTLSSLCVKLLAFSGGPNIPVFQYVVTYWLICLVASVWMFRIKGFKPKEQQPGKQYKVIQLTSPAGVFVHSSTDEIGTEVVGLYNATAFVKPGSPAFGLPPVALTQGSPVTQGPTRMTQLGSTRSPGSTWGTPGSAQIPGSTRGGTPVSAQIPGLARGGTPGLAPKPGSAQKPGSTQVTPGLTRSTSGSAQKVGSTQITPGLTRSTSGSAQKAGSTQPGQPGSTHINRINSIIRHEHPISPNKTPESLSSTAATSTTTDECDTPSYFFVNNSPAPKKCFPNGRVWLNKTFAVRSFPFYLALGFLDVQGGFLTVVAFRYASLSSSALIDWVSLLTTFALCVQFTGEVVTRSKIVALLAGLAGSMCILYSDSQESTTGLVASESSITNLKLFGDLTCVLAAIFLGIVTVMMEMALQSGAMAPEVLLHGFGSAAILGTIQSLIFEWKKITELCSMTFRQWIYFMGAAGTMTAAYLISPIVLETCSSAFYSLSLLTSAALAVLLSAALFNDTISSLYLVGLGIILVSLALYHKEETLDSWGTENGM